MKTTIYHSTVETCLNNILESKSVKTKKTDFNKNKSPGNLGYGFYGFSDKDLCKQYGEEKLKNFKLLSCDILLSDENTLDFRIEENLKFYNEFKNRIKNKREYKYQEKVNFNTDYQSSFEGAIIELFLRHIKSERNICVDCLIAMTVTQVSTARKSLVANGTEYCVKNNNIIKEMKEVKL